jgi:hypothetical protein
VLFGIWGLYATMSILIFGGARNSAAIAAVGVMGLLAVGSVVAGGRVARGHGRAVLPLAGLLAVQSVRLAIPGLVWLVSLGWTLNVVLYARGAAQPDSQDIAVLVGSHALGAHVAINIITLVPCAALLLWRRAAASRTPPAQDPAPAV